MRPYGALGLAAHARLAPFRQNSHSENARFCGRLRTPMTTPWSVPFATSMSSIRRCPTLLAMDAPSPSTGFALPNGSRGCPPRRHPSIGFLENVCIAPSPSRSRVELDTREARLLKVQMSCLHTYFYFYFGDTRYATLRALRSMLYLFIFASALHLARSHDRHRPSIPIPMFAPLAPP
eukprot:scaffold41421_cov36-Tisochrysis_lutea.AAC.1